MSPAAPEPTRKLRGKERCTIPNCPGPSYTSNSRARHLKQWHPELTEPLEQPAVSTHSSTTNKHTAIASKQGTSTITQNDAGVEGPVPAVGGNSVNNISDDSSPNVPVFNGSTPPLDHFRFTFRQRCPLQDDDGKREREGAERFPIAYFKGNLEKLQQLINIMLVFCHIHGRSGWVWFGAKIFPAEEAVEKSSKWPISLMGLYLLFGDLLFRRGFSYKLREAAKAFPDSWSDLYREIYLAKKSRLSQAPAKKSRNEVVTSTDGDHSWEIRDFDNGVQTLERRTVSNMPTLVPDSNFRGTASQLETMNEPAPAMASGHSHEASGAEGMGNRDLSRTSRLNISNHRGGIDASGPSPEDSDAVAHGDDGSRRRVARKRTHSRSTPTYDTSEAPDVLLSLLDSDQTIDYTTTSDQNARFQENKLSSKQTSATKRLRSSAPSQNTDVNRQSVHDAAQQMSSTGSNTLQPSRFVKSSYMASNTNAGGSSSRVHTAHSEEIDPNDATREQPTSSQDFMHPHSDWKLANSSELLSNRNDKGSLHDSTRPQSSLDTPKTSQKEHTAFPLEASATYGYDDRSDTTGLERLISEKHETLQHSDHLSEKAINIVLAAFSCISRNSHVVRFSTKAVDALEGYRGGQRLIIPTFIDRNGCHWTLGVVDTGTGHITLYDPHVSRTYLQDTEESVECLLDHGPLWLIQQKFIHEYEATPFSKDDYDSGIYILVFALFIMFDKQIPTSIDPTLWRSIFQSFLRDDDADRAVFDHLHAAFKPPASLRAAGDALTRVHDETLNGVQDSEALDPWQQLNSLLSLMLKVNEAAKNTVRELDEEANTLRSLSVPSDAPEEIMEEIVDRLTQLYDYRFLIRHCASRFSNILKQAEEAKETLVRQYDN